MPPAPVGATLFPLTCRLAAYPVEADTSHGACAAVRPAPILTTLLPDAVLRTIGLALEGVNARRVRYPGVVTVVGFEAY